MQALEQRAQTGRNELATGATQRSEEPLSFCFKEDARAHFFTSLSFFRSFMPCNLSWFYLEPSFARIFSIRVYLISA